MTVDSSVASSRHHAISLPTGELCVDVERSDLPLEHLCGFAARRNPKRGFLFVSRVLGKHIPVRPSIMRDVHTRLAAKIPVDLPGPVVVVGMAETAVALGHGIFDQYRRATARDDLLFIHSTRYRLERPAALEFIEEHSHAADHIIYLPVEPRAAQLFACARTLVLVDDEASTGKTFVNLTRAFAKSFPSLQNVVTVVITDWRGQDQRRANAEAMPVPSLSAGLLHGRYSFQSAPNLVAVKMPDVTGNGAVKDALLPRNYGRLALTGAVDERLLQAALAQARERRLVSDGARHLVVGTGEFTYPPFLLAERLEQAGHEVFYQSTTRSPIMEGGAVASTITFADNYEDGIANFLYNARSGRYDRVVICHETPAGTIDPALLTELAAGSLEM